MAAALPEGGHIDACELDPERAAFAQGYFDRSPYGSRITLHVGPALETIDELEGEFDFVFIDADKEGYVAYYDAAALLAKGAVIDLDAQLRPEKGWAAQKADIFPDMLSSSSWAGKLAGMPCYTNNSAIIYSPQLLAQIGVTEPKADWNWQDFQDLAQKGNKPPDRWGYDWNWVYWSNWLGSAGGLPISSDGQKITMTTPEAQDTITYLTNLFKIGVTPTKMEGELFNKTKGTGVVFES